MAHPYSGSLASRFCQAAIVAVLALLLLLPSGNVIAYLSAAPAGETGDLTITTEPDGAMVFVDGRLAGASPLDIKGLDAGDHKVRVSKNGYLENVRSVTVAAGKPVAVKVNLTPYGGATAAAAPGGGSKKWLLIGAGVVGVGAAAYILTKNSPPVVTGITVTPSGTGMVGYTNFSFTAAASDKDGDSLTYSWTFGDGGTGSGATAAHVFTTQGAPTVAVTVSDGKKSASTSTTVTVGPNMTALWTGGREGAFGCSVNWNLTQNGSSLTGSMNLSGGCTGTLTGVTGTVNAQTHPSSVSFQAPPYSFTSGGLIYPGQNMSFSGTTNAAGTTMTGSLRLRQIPGSFDQSYAATYNR